MLKCYLPFMIDHPPGNEIVIVGMKRTHKAKKAVFVEKAMYKIRRRQDLSTVRRCTSRDTEQTSIDGGCCCTIKIMTFKIQSPNEIPEVS